MTMGSTAPDRGEALREQAATWFARMRRPDAEDFRAEFESWLAQDLKHRAAYNRIAGRFSEAKILRDGASPCARDRITRPFRRHRTLVLAATLSLLLTAGWLLLTASGSFRGESRLAAAAGNASTPIHLESARGQIRTLRLTDGSLVTLDADSQLAVAFTSLRRQFRLVRGRARFDVAHEARPFIVAAGSGTVTARGTLFDVAFGSQGRVSVVLLRGAVDVAVTPQNGTDPVVQQLKPGRAVEYRTNDRVITPVVLTKTQPDWLEGLTDFHETELSAIVAQANRHSATQIRLGDPELGSLKLSGRFRINDAQRLSDNAARIFGLSADRTRPNEIVLRRK
jgi:transmembrane sensor